MQGADALADTFNRQGDPYRALLAQTLADRLAEATSEWLHYQVRTHLWGYHPHEPFDPDKLRRGQYPGIRPAVGYPALPDQSLIFDLDRLLHLGGIGIALTESGAMHPARRCAGCTCPTRRRATSSWDPSMPPSWPTTPAAGAARPMK